jgi:diacylglycerol kinase (ATP)
LHLRHDGGSVRIGLIHNSDAGDAVARDALTALMARHGHDVAWVRHLTDDATPFAVDGLDAVAAAGGDGTVRAVAARLAAHDVPLAILPMGTANNTARTLGVPVDVDAAVDLWSTAGARAFDLGLATGPFGERWFLESVGGGLVTQSIVVMDRAHAPGAPPAAQIARALTTYDDVLPLVEAEPWQLTIDSQTWAGNFVLVEVLNMAAIGPNLRFSDAASPWDGAFTIVAAGLDDRARLDEYLQQRRRGEAPPPSLPTWHGSTVTLTTTARLHVDDAVLDASGQPVQLRLVPAALRVLVPVTTAHLRDR